MGMGHIRIRVVWVSLIALGGSFRQLKRPKRYLDAIEAKVGEGEPSSVLYPPLEFGLKLEGPALVLRTCPRALPVDRSLPARDPVDNLLGPVPLFSTPFGSEIFDELPSGVRIPVRGDPPSRSIDSSPCYRPFAEFGIPRVVDHQ